MPGDVRPGSFHIVIVTFNSAAQLPLLLGDLQAGVAQDGHRVTVVDNGSDDETVAVAERAGWVRVVQCPHNPGYAGGINAARHADPDHPGPLLILNPDLRLQPGAVETLLAEVLRPGAGVVVPTMTNLDGDIYPSLRREPSLRRSIGDAALGRRLSGRPANWSEIIWDVSSYRSIADVDWATGAVLAISRECDRTVGDWDDDRFFMYSEESDYCRRVRDAGFAVRHVPAAVVIHEGGGSGSSPALGALLAVNKVRYYAKHHNPIAARAFWAIAVLGAALRLHQPAARLTLKALFSHARAASLPGGRTGLLKW